MLSCSIWYSAPTFWMGGGLESQCVGRHHPHPKLDLRSGSQDHHPPKNSVQKTICCNSTSKAPDDGRMCPKQVELRIHQQNYLVAPSWHLTFFKKDAVVGCLRLDPCTTLKKIAKNRTNSQPWKLMDQQYLLNNRKLMVIVLWNGQVYKVEPYIK